MRLKAHMISIKYANEVDLDTKEPVINKITILDPKKYKKGTLLGLDTQDTWYAFTHYRGVDNPFIGYKLGFELTHLTEDEESQSYNLSISAGDDTKRYPLRYDKVYNLYFDSRTGSVKKGRLDFGKKETATMPVGTDTAGTFYIDVFDHAKNKVYTSPAICVLPSSMSPEDYKVMLDDLLQIKDDLVINSKSKVGFKGNWEYRRSSVAECLELIEKPLNRINQNPTVSLSAEWKKESFQWGKKTKPRTLIAKELMPFKTKHHVQTYTKNIDIYENRMIKYALRRLKEKIKNDANRYETDYLNWEKELKKVKDHAKIKFGKSVEEKVAELKSKISNAEKNIRNYEKENLAQNIYKINSIWNYPVRAPGDMDIIFNIYRESHFDDSKIKVDIRNRTCEVMLNSSKSDSLCLNYKKYHYNLGNGWEGTQFNARVATLRMETGDLNNIVFLIENIFEQNNLTSPIEIRARAKKRDIYLDDPLGQDYYNKWKKEMATSYCLDITQIYEINGVKALLYNEKYVREKVLLYADGTELDRLKKILDDLNEEKSLVMSLINQSQIAHKNKMAFLDQEKNWSYLNSKIDSLLALAFFKDVKDIHCVWQPTQIFVRDSNYGIVYKQLKNLDSRIDFLSELDGKEFAVKVTHEIYEYWCFFKMIQVLINKQKWELTNYGEIAAWLNSTQKKDYLQASLSHKTREGRPINLTIYFNRTVYYKSKGSSNQQNKRPDYTLIYDYNGVSKIAYMDAKYRNYTEQGQALWLKDMKDVAIGKYIKAFREAEEGWQNEPVTSFIIHPETEDRWTFFGGSLKDGLDKKLAWEGEAPMHRFGSFSLVPSQIINFSTFLKMLMEYHIGIYDCCWNCGETIHSQERIVEDPKTTKGGYLKYHYTCNTCGVFWVKTHCRKKAHELIKHSYNYHFVDKNGASPWFVECPKCEDPY